VDAAKLLQKKLLPSQLVIKLIGNGPLKSHLVKRCETEKINLVQFHDPIPKDQIYQFLSQADAFILLLKDSPLFKWGVSPNKLFDYMAMSQPIIYGINSEFNPIRQTQSGITVLPDAPQAVADAIMTLIQTPPDARKIMGQHAYEYVSRLHHVDKLAAELETILSATIRTEPPA